MNLLLPGLYPRSERLVALTRDVDRQRATFDSLEKAWHEETESLCLLQKGLPYITTGLFRWQDLLRPFTDLIEGAHAEALQRFFETNTFWRRLDFNKDTTIDEHKLDGWINKYFLGGGVLGHDDAELFTLPYLFLFRDYSSGASAQQIASLLEKVALKLLEYPNKALVFMEPSFGWRPLNQEEKELGRELLQNIKRQTAAPVYLWSCFFPVKDSADYLFSLPVDGFGVDFYANDAKALLQGFPKDKLLLAGLINTETTLIESKAALESFLELMHGAVSAGNIIVTPNGPADLLPKEVMDHKVTNMRRLLAC